MSLNPFLIRAMVQIAPQACLTQKRCLNPFLIRAMVQIKLQLMHGVKCLNPFLIRAMVQITKEKRGARERKVLIPS